MKRIALALFLLVVAIAPPAFGSSWFDDEVSSPGNNAVILDTGPMTSGSRSVSFMVHSTLAGTFEFQLTDTDGTTVLHKQKLTVVSGQADFALSTNVTIDIATDQHLRIISKQALTLGMVSASIWTQ